MSCKRAPRRDGFVLTCDDCGHQVGLATSTALEGFPLAARKGWTCGAKVDRCPGCARKQAAKVAAAKPAARGAGATPKRRAASSSKR